MIEWIIIDGTLCSYSVNDLDHEEMRRKDEKDFTSVLWNYMYIGV